MLKVIQLQMLYSIILRIIIKVSSSSLAQTTVVSQVRVDGCTARLALNTDSLSIKYKQLNGTPIMHILTPHH